MRLSISHRTVQRAAITGIVTAVVLGTFAGRTRDAVSAGRSSHPRVLIFGGGSSHNFTEAYGDTDRNTLTAAGDSAHYIDTFANLPTDLQSADVLVQAGNQLPEPDRKAQQAITDFLNAGGGLVAVHAGAWYNWPGWPDYNRLLLGGGTRSHDKFGEFEVTVTAPAHPVMKGLPAHFKVSDELYHQEMDPQGSPVDVLATAASPLTGKTYPSIWIVNHGPGRIVCIALGHDGKTHGDPTYKQLLVNATSWAAKTK